MNNLHFVYYGIITPRIICFVLKVFRLIIPWKMETETANHFYSELLNIFHFIVLTSISCVYFETMSSLGHQSFLNLLPMPLVQPMLSISVCGIAFPIQRPNENRIFRNNFSSFACVYFILLVFW